MELPAFRRAGEERQIVGHAGKVPAFDDQHIRATYVDGGRCLDALIFDSEQLGVGLGELNGFALAVPCRIEKKKKLEGAYRKPLVICS